MNFVKTGVRSYPMFHALLLTSLIALSAPASSTPLSPGFSWNAPARAALLTQIETALDQYFAVAKISALRAALETHRLEDISQEDPQKFASLVTSQLYQVVHDKHLSVTFSSEPIPVESFAQRHIPSAARAFGRYINFGYNSAVRLNGNIGYLSIGGFAPLSDAKPAIDAALSMVAHTDALLIDLRGNQGGDPSSLDYLMGYFLRKPTQLTGIEIRISAGFNIERQFSAAKVTGARYLGRPIYVLVDSETISAAEQLAYDVKVLRLGTIVGETTAGGANPGRAMRLTTHFRIFVPFGQARNPYTHTNWEGVGVQPDVRTSSPDSLLAAFTLALKNAPTSYPPAATERRAFLTDPGKALEQSLPIYQHNSQADRP